MACAIQRSTSTARGGDANSSLVEALVRLLGFVRTIDLVGEPCRAIIRLECRKSQRYPLKKAI